MKRIKDGRLKTNSKMLKPKYFFYVLLIIFAISNLATFAQDGRYTNGNAEQTLRSAGRINTSTHALDLNIPLGSYNGRGINVPVSLNYSSKVWRMEYRGLEKRSGLGDQGCFSLNVPKYSETSASGWTSSMRIAIVEYTGKDNIFDGDGRPVSSDLCSENSNGNNGYVRRIQIHLPGGSSHELRASDTPITYPSNSNPAPINMNATYYSVDGSNLKYIEGSAKLYLPDGSYYNFGGVTTDYNGKTIRKATQHRDVNGNRLLFYAPTINYPNGYWKDSLDRIIPIPITPEAPTTAQVVDYDMPSINNGTMTYKFHWKQLKGVSAAESGLTDFNQNLRHVGDHSGEPDGFNSPTGPVLFSSGWENKAIATQSDPLFNPIVLTTVEFPDGSKYKLSYNIFGEIDHIDYPTGGEENLLYGTKLSLSDIGNNYPIKQSNRGVTQREVKESSGATPYITNYSTAQGATTATMKVTTTASNGAKVERELLKDSYNCSGSSCQGSWGFSDILSGSVLEERTYASTGQIVSKIKKTWERTEFYVNGDYDATWHPRVTKIESIIYDLSGNYLSNTSTMEYAGNLDDIDDHLTVNLTKQYGYSTSIGGLGALERQTETTLMEYDSSINWPEYENLHIIGLPTKTVIKDGQEVIVAQSEVKYDESGYSGGSYRGQITTVRKWIDTDNSWIETRTKYDSHGNIIETKDANGNISKIEYDDNFSDGVNRLSKAFPTKTISATPGGNGSTTPFETIAKYDFSTGLVVSRKNPNGHTTQIEYNDPLLRPTKEIAPNGQMIITEYGIPDVNGFLPESERFVKTKSQIDATKWSEVYTWLDGLGRTIKTETSNEDGAIFYKIKYDSLGRVEKKSNPYRGENTPDNQLEWTQNYYDVAGRTEKIQTPDLAEFTTMYSIATTGSDIGVVTTVTDQAGKQRRSITNGLGQLKRVDESTLNGLGSIINPNQPTYYNYDTLSNLTVVNQGVQTRTFQYDSLSRLKDSTSPESGTISYLYDNNGNVVSKTDARNTTTYTYDSLNRVKVKSYSDSITPSSNYYYDNVTNAKGSLIKVVTGDTSNPFSVTDFQSFDIMGRATQSQQTTDGTSYNPMTYTYNLSGAMTEQKYPSGRIVKTVLDDDGMLSLIQSRKNINAGFLNYAKAFTYTAAGGVGSLQLGNGKWESTTFNSRLQPTQIALGTVKGGSDKLNLLYEYHLQGQNDNNGNLLKQTITVPTVGTNNGFTAVQTYSYDSLNRIKSAKENIDADLTPSWKQTFDYDRYGNRNFDETNTTTIPKNCQSGGIYIICASDRQALNPSISPINNRIIEDQDNDQIDDYKFDLAGNTTDIGNRKYTYDGENKQIKVETIDANGNVTGLVGEYFYDGNGKRVKKKTANQETIFIYDANGRIVAEYSTEISQTPKVSYLTNDYLGSPRITTDKDGKVNSRRDFMPFGEEITSLTSPQRTTGLGYSSDTVSQKFTGYERDSETDLNFAQARMHSSYLGRFSTTDPLLSSANPTNPQTFNRYAYVLNNPLKFVDPSGLLPVYVKKVLDDGTIRFYSVDDTSPQYKELLKQGFTLYEPKAGEAFVNTKGEIIQFKENELGFTNLGKATTAKIYIWWPGSDDSKVGHLAIEFILGDKSIYISFYPKNFDGKRIGHWYKEHDSDLWTKKQDEKTSTSKPDVYEVSGLSWAKANAYFEKLKENPGKWSVGRNCADIVAEALQASGLNIQNNQPSNTTIPLAVKIIGNGAAADRNYDQQVTWKSNWTNGWEIPDY